MWWWLAGAPRRERRDEEEESIMTGEANVAVESFKGKISEKR